MLATGLCDKTIKIWNCSSGECVRKLYGHMHFIQCLELTRYNELISFSRDHTFRIWNLSEGKCIQIFDEHTDVVWCIRMDLNEKLKRGSNGRFFSGSQDVTIKTRDLDSFECIQTINAYFSIFRLEFFKGVCKL
jgi:WD40 repeat protein